MVLSFLLRRIFVFAFLSTFANFLISLKTGNLAKRKIILQTSTKVVCLHCKYLEITIYL